MSQQALTIISISEITDMGDLQFLGQLEFNGELFDELSSTFTGNGDQITFIPANGKTFYHVRSRLYPASTDTVTANFTVNTNISNTHRVEMDLTYDGTSKDHLSYEFFARQNDSSSDLAAVGNIGQFETNTHESMEGDGIKAIKLTSSSTSGTFIVHMEGYTKDTGTSP